MQAFPHFRISSTPITFTLHHFAELSLPEVAEIMHSSTATTKSRLRLAREKLREKLSARGVEG
jgi:RNA polymerase sigma-70 factor (ECF subfamily)